MTEREEKVLGVPLEGIELPRRKNRRSERKKALNVLYHLELRELLTRASESEDPESFINGLLSDILSDYGIEEESFSFKLLKITLTRLKEIDSLLLEFIEPHRWSTLPPLERSLLRLGVAQLLPNTELQDVPTEVAIDETVELAKRYSYRNFHKFVNAILDKVAKRIGTNSGKDLQEDIPDSTEAVQ